MKINKISSYLSMGKSTSFHILNGDNKLSFPLIVIFRIINYINNLFPNSKLDKKLEIRNFNIDKNDLKRLLSKIQRTQVPSRKLSNIFWYSLPWNEIKKELKEINILDIGCGRGAYAKKFINFSKQCINSYTGIDIKKHKNWNMIKRKHINVNFYVCNEENIPNFPNINFIVSQSTLEHIKHDLTYFKSINKFITSKNIIQCHLFPSKACFNIFKLHGIRQYTPKTISKITKLFKNKSYKILFNLGGDKCNLIHISFINYPRRHGTGDLRIDNIDLYDKLTYYAIKKDIENFQEHPNFYALLIHSNYKNRII